MNLGATRLRGRPRNRWQDGVREDVRIVGGEGWQEKIHNREEWKKLLRTARNCQILHMPMEWMNEWMTYYKCVYSLSWPSCKAHAPCYNVTVAYPAVPYFPTLSHKQHEFSGKKIIIEHKMCVLILIATTYVWMTHHSQKNWARIYHKCTWVSFSFSSHCSPTKNRAFHNVLRDYKLL